MKNYYNNTMKKTNTGRYIAPLIHVWAFCCLLLPLPNTAQVIADFENFNLNPPGTYAPSTNTAFVSSGLKFPYNWNSSFGGYWSGGWAYTNAWDSTTAGFTNLYGVKAYKGYNQSSVYVVGQDRARLILSQPGTTLTGFYVTNTTYAYKAIKFGDPFCRKFGDTTGTKSGGLYPQGGFPDFFKLSIRPYRYGQLQFDSAVVYLADYRSAVSANDFILDQWTWCSTSSLGQADSLEMRLFSSDVGSFGINTPLFFAIDHCMAELSKSGIYLNRNNPCKHWYNPSTDRIARSAETPESTKYTVCDARGILLYRGTWSGLELYWNTHVQPGMYYLSIQSTGGASTLKIFRQL